MIATYSADLVALVAALLALAGMDDDRGSGSKVDFANATERLNGRVRLVCQRGRLLSPVGAPRILAILDRYICEAPLDESESSWHLKASLVKLRADSDDSTQWRLWIGSRNLTRDLAWDSGLVLVGREGGDGQIIPGVAELGEELAAYAQLACANPARVRSALQGVRWLMPEGIQVEEVRLHKGAPRELPVPPHNITSLTVVSPFLDGTVVGALGKWGDRGTRNLLVSTQRQIAKLAAQAGRPLARFQELLSVEAPSLDADEELATSSSDASEDTEPEHRGLHAKLIYAEHAGRRTLWMGSANATRRAWNGPNMEVVCKLALDASNAEGFSTFVREIASTVRIENLPAHQVDEIGDRLSRARSEVSARWMVVQRQGKSGPVLTADVPPHPDDREIELFVGLLSCEPLAWPRFVSTVQLPPVSASDLTQLTKCRLTLGQASVEWLQKTTADPPLAVDRDRRALARYLDPRTFLRWLRSLLVEDPLADGGGDWDGSRKKGKRDPNSRAPEWWAPTIEEALRAWTRDPTRLADVDRKVRHYLKLIEEEQVDEISEEDRLVIQEFRSTWAVLRNELVP